MSDSEKRPFELTPEEAEAVIKGHREMMSFPDSEPIDLRKPQRSEPIADQLRHGSVLFGCGTRAKLTQLNQSKTYSGMLEGYPNSQVNQMLVQRFVDRVQQAAGRKLLLIKPHETPRPSRAVDENLPWMELPSIKCEARLFSSSLGEFGSSLIVCWFQSAFALPIAQDVLDVLSTLQWHEHALPHDDF